MDTHKDTYTPKQQPSWAVAMTTQGGTYRLSVILLEGTVQKDTHVRFFTN